MAISWTLAVEVGGGRVSAARRGPDGTRSVELSADTLTGGDSFLTSVVRQARPAEGPDLPEALIVVHPGSWSGPDLAMVGQAAVGAGLPRPAFVARSSAFAQSAASDLTPGMAVAILEGAATGYEIALLERTQSDFRPLGTVGSVPAPEQTPDAATTDEDLLIAAVRELTFVLADADVAPDAVRRLLVAGPAAQ
jgi:hypothetical protein